jgi:hypothetical protein
MNIVLPYAGPYGRGETLMIETDSGRPSPQRGAK